MLCFWTVQALCKLIIFTDPNQKRTPEKTIGDLSCLVDYWSRMASLKWGKGWQCLPPPTIWSAYPPQFADTSGSISAAHSSPVCVLPWDRGRVWGWGRMQVPFPNGGWWFSQLIPFWLICLWVERGIVRFKCLAQQHITIWGGSRGVWVKPPKLKKSTRHYNTLT